MTVAGLAVRRLTVVGAITGVAGVLMAALDLGVPTRAGIVAGICLLLWLTEWLPAWMPTVLLLVATPMLVGPLDARFTLRPVLGWSIDPVLALFLGGFVLAAAAHRHGVDRALARAAIARAGGSPARLVVAAAVMTALLSMWMSNVAAAALMLGAFRPIWDAEPEDSALRRAILLGIALAADVGGIATPIGTGPNGIAMAAVAHVRPIGFLHWMAFGVPLAFGLVAASLALVLARLARAHPAPLATIASATTAEAGLPVRPPYRRLGTIFGLTVLLWLSEPLHGIPAWIVALGTVVTLLATGVVRPRDVLHIDWGTLLLVAGGIAMGALLDRSGVVHDLAAVVPLADLAPVLRLFILCVLTAALSALMSNTGTAALLIPLAATVDPAPSTAIIIAVASSLGIPFVVSTPPNAMAVASGLRSADLLVPGIIVMLGGCALVALTGPAVLRAVGVP